MTAPTATGFHLDFMIRIGLPQLQLSRQHPAGDR
jgi:hypothetical protein